MATQFKKTVKPSGGDYSSLEACMNANEQDLVAADQYFDVEIDGDWTGVQDSYCHVHNYTTDATRRINIYTTSAARSSNGVYDSTKYSIRGPYGGSCMDVDSEFVSVKGLQIDSNTGYGIGIGANNVTVAYCIVRNANFAGYGLAIEASYVQGALIYNNVAYNCDHGIRVRGGNFYVTNSWIFNNTVVNCGTDGITCNSTINGYKPIAKNNLVDNCVVNYSGDWDSTSDYNASTDATHPYSSASHDRVSQTFSFNNRSGNDFRLISSDAGAKDHGTSLSSYFSDDIIGNPRSGSWDIGAFEYVSTDTNKTVTDTGSGSDSIAQIAVSLALTDTGHGADGFGGGVAAAVPLSEVGHGTDIVAKILASLALSDSGHGTDTLAQLLASMTVSDTGHGTDAPGNIAASIPVSESGIGTDAIAQILASLSIADAGQGTDAALAMILVAIPDSGSGADTVYQISVSAPVQDAGQGVDQVAQISATISLADIGQGQDIPQISATVSVPDSGTGLDLVNLLSEALKAIADSGVGVDFVSSIAVVVPVADIGAGVDFLGTIDVLLQVLDMGRGTEIVIRQMDTRLIAEIRFTGKAFPRFHGAPYVSFTGKKLPRFKA